MYCADERDDEPHVFRDVSLTKEKYTSGHGSAMAPPWLRCALAPKVDIQSSWSLGLCLLHFWHHILLGPNG